MKSKPERITWIWPPHVGRGLITMVTGHPLTETSVLNNCINIGESYQPWMGRNAETAPQYPYVRFPRVMVMLSWPEGTSEGAKDPERRTEKAIEFLFESSPYVHIHKWCPPIAPSTEEWAKITDLLLRTVRARRYDLVVFDTPDAPFWAPGPLEQLREAVSMLKRLKDAGVGVYMLNYRRPAHDLRLKPLTEYEPADPVSEQVMSICDVVGYHLPIEERPSDEPKRLTAVLIVKTPLKEDTLVCHWVRLTPNRWRATEWPSSPADSLS